jgi:hypothetical protein
MQWTRRSLLGAGLAAAPWLAAAADDADRYPLWTVGGGGARVFLFGDCGSVSDPWRSPRIERAFAESAVFWKETPDPGPGDLAGFLAAGVDPKRPLSTWLTTDQRLRVAQFAEAVGSTYARFEPFKPWFAAQALNQVSMQRQSWGGDPLPVLSAEAKSAAKPVRTEFPDIPALVRWFDAFPDRAQVEYLMSMVETIQAGPAGFAKRTAAWTNGDLSLETARVLRQMRLYPEAYEAETASRNRRWPARFGAMLAAGGTTFVLVGADHLVGPQSVFAQLDAAGLRARRI